MQNKTSAILVGISIILLMLAIVIFKEGIFGMGIFSKANVSINLTSETSILVENNIDFGSGRVNSTATHAVLDSAQVSAVNGSWNWGAPQYVFVMNDGTVNISVNITSSDDASSFIGGTNPEYKIKGITTEIGSCVQNFSATYFELSTVSQTLCGLLRFSSTCDTFNASIRISIPSDAPVGTRTSTLTFTGRCLANCG